MSWAEKALAFLQLSLSKKITYARRPGQRPLYDDFSITMRLTWNQPDFLQIEEELVEMLIRAEMHVENQQDESCLMLLFQDPKAK